MGTTISSCLGSQGNLSFAQILTISDDSCSCFTVTVGLSIGSLVLRWLGFHRTSLLLRPLLTSPQLSPRRSPYSKVLNLSGRAAELYPLGFSVTLDFVVASTLILPTRLAARSCSCGRPFAYHFFQHITSRSAPCDFGYGYCHYSRSSPFIRLV